MPSFHQGHCDQCGRRSAHLVEGWEIDMEGYQTTGEPDYRSILVCARCQSEEAHPSGEVFDWTDFNLNLLVGKIAQVLVETVFFEFQWEVFPYGYESYFTSVIRLLAGLTSAPATKIRTMPDLVVVGPSGGGVNLLEVKGTSATEDFLLDARVADRYAQLWPEALLVVYSMPAKEIYVAEIGSLEYPDREPTEFSDGTPAKSVRLGQDLMLLEERFNFSRPEYDRIVNQSLYRVAKFV